MLLSAEAASDTGSWVVIVWFYAAAAASSIMASLVQRLLLEASAHDAMVREIISHANVLAKCTSSRVVAIEMRFNVAYGAALRWAPYIVLNEATRYTFD